MELSTDDPTAAKAFYKKLFGWKLKDQQMPNGVYTTFDTRTGGPGGGITAKTMPGQPTAWLPYVGVKSVKKSMEKAKALGAMPVVEYDQIPGYGALAIFVDPTGATFALWEADQKAARPAPKKKAAKKASRRKKK